MVTHQPGIWELVRRSTRRYLILVGSDVWRVTMRSVRSLFKKYHIRAAACLLGGLVLGWSAPAVAAGFFLPTRGVESTARGGASFAPHRADLDALWHNPAGLTHLENLQLTVDLAAVHVHVSHQRVPRQMDDGSTRTYDSVANAAPPNTIPTILIGGPTPHPDISWAAGAYTHYAAGARYPEEGPQRYVLIDNTDSAMGYLHGAISWQLTEELAIGAGLQNFMGTFQIYSRGSAYSGMFGDPEDEDLDIMSLFEMSSFFTPTANLGALYHINDRLLGGLSIQMPHLMRDRSATLQTRWPDHPSFDNAQTSGDEVDVAIPFPFYIRGGLRYVGNRFDVEAALVYQHWSIVDEVIITPDDVEVTGLPGVGSLPVEAFAVPQNFRNTFSIHLGGEFTVMDTLDLRGGYVFERGAVPDENYSVFALDPDKHQFSAGASYHFGAWSVDAMAGAIVMPSKEITNSEVRQINPSDPDDEYTLIVGNGTYDHFGYLGGLALRYDW